MLAKLSIFLCTYWPLQLPLLGMTSLTLPILKPNCFVFSLLIYKNSLCILDMTPFLIKFLLFCSPLNVPIFHISLFFIFLLHYNTQRIFFFFSGIYPRYLWSWIIQLSCTTRKFETQISVKFLVFLSIPYPFSCLYYRPFSVYRRVFKADKKRYPLSWKLLAKFTSFARLIRKDFCGKNLRRLSLTFELYFLSMS